MEEVSGLSIDFMRYFARGKGVRYAFLKREPFLHEFRGRKRVDTRACTILGVPKVSFCTDMGILGDRNSSTSPPGGHLG